MQIFKDSATQKVWAFEDDVTADNSSGAYVFTAPNGMVLKTPTTLQPYTPPAPNVLAEAQTAKIANLYSAYSTANSQDISFTTAGGVTKTFQADSVSRGILQESLQGYSVAGKVPSGFYWVSTDNTHVTFTLADLKGLYTAILDRGWTNFQNLQNKKNAVKSATTVSSVNAIIF